MVDNIASLPTPAQAATLLVSPTPVEFMLMTLGLDVDKRPSLITSSDSLDAARVIAESSGRRLDTPVRKSFVRSGAETRPPLADLYAGGRSGAVAVKLYLALLWRCASPPYSTDKPARAWATLLDLPDPAGRGARRVKAAMKALAARQLVSIAEQPGQPNVVTLLDEGGLARRYALPSSSYTRAVARGAKRDRLDREVYFKVSTTLWTQGYLQQLTGAGLVMLLILLAEQAGQGKEVWISPAAFAERYNISHKTRTNGTKDLVQLGLLTIRREPLAAKPNASVFDPRKVRNVYRLTARAQDTPAAGAIAAAP